MALKPCTCAPSQACHTQVPLVKARCCFYQHGQLHKAQDQYGSLSYIDIILLGIPSLNFWTTILNWFWLKQGTVEEGCSCYNTHQTCLSILITYGGEAAHLYQLNDVDVVQFLQDGYFLIDPVQWCHGFWLLSGGCFWPSGRRPTCNCDNVVRKTSFFSGVWHAEVSSCLLLCRKPSAVLEDHFVSMTVSTWNWDFHVLFRPIQQVLEPGATWGGGRPLGGQDSST